jgi:hypothetical protein
MAKTIISKATTNKVTILFKASTLSLVHFVLIVLKKEGIVKGRCNGEEPPGFMIQ